MKKETKEGEEKQVFELKKDMKAEIAELISQHEKEYRRSKINQRIHEILGWYIRVRTESQFSAFPFQSDAVLV
jgi:hypothetical protein